MCLDVCIVYKKDIISFIYGAKQKINSSVNDTTKLIQHSNEGTSIISIMRGQSSNVHCKRVVATGAVRHHSREQRQSVASLPRSNQPC